MSKKRRHRPGAARWRDAAHRRLSWLALDLLCGRVVPGHQLRESLLGGGATEAEIVAFAEHPRRTGTRRATAGSTARSRGEWRIRSYLMCMGALENGELAAAARETAAALRAEAEVARLQARMSRERADKLRSVAEGLRRETELTPEPDRAVRARHAGLADQHARIAEREAANQDAEAQRAQSEAANAEARARRGSLRDPGWANDSAS